MLSTRWECKYPFVFPSPLSTLANKYCSTAYDVDQPFAELLNSAIVLPIFDGGNVGIRRRHMQQLMQSPNYDPWAATYGSV